MIAEIVFGILAIFAAVMFLGSITIFLFFAIKDRTIFWWQNNRTEPIELKEVHVNVDDIIKQIGN